MQNHEKFVNFVNKFKDTNPLLIESIVNGFAVIFEDSTEQRVKQIQAKLAIKPIDEAKPTGVEGGLENIYSDLVPEPLDKDKDKPVEPTT